MAKKMISCIFMFIFFCLSVVVAVTFVPRGGGEGTPQNNLYGEAPPERSTFSDITYDSRRVGISLVEVYERVGKSVISVCTKALPGLTDAFYGSEKFEKMFWFCD